MQASPCRSSRCAIAAAPGHDSQSSASDEVEVFRVDFPTELSTPLTKAGTGWSGCHGGIGHNRRCRLDRKSPLLSIIQAAGWPIWPLLLCSVVALALIIERAYHLRVPLVAPPKLLDEVVGVMRHNLPGIDVVNKLDANSVLGSVLAAGLRAVVADPRIDEDTLRQAFENAGRKAMHQLERYLNALGTIATAAPLLGLLGTVIGMIEIFGSQSPSGTTNPQMLAHGISVALYNTAFGLIIAIPALMCHRYFRGRVEDFQLTMELSASHLVPHLMRVAARNASTT